MGSLEEWPANNLTLSAMSENQTIQSLFNLGKYDEASHQIRTRHSNWRENNFLSKALGLAELALGNYSEAKNALLCSTTLDDTDDVIWYNLGVIWGREKKFQMEFDAYCRALTINNNNVKALHNLGRCYERLDKIEPAIGLYEKAILVDPNYKKAFLSLANLYYRGNNPRHAEAVLGRLISRSLDAQDICTAVELTLKFGFLDVARSMLVRLPPEIINTDLKALSIYLDSLSHESPSAELQKLHVIFDSNPSNSRVAYFLGYSYLRLSLLDRAIQFLDLARQLDSTNLEIKFALATALYRSKNYGAAHFHLQGLVRQSSSDSRIYNNLGLLYADLGFLRTAHRYLKKAVSFDQFNIGYWSNILFIENYRFKNAILACGSFKSNVVGKYISEISEPKCTHKNKKSPLTHLRIGFLSGDFRNHPVGRVIKFLLPYIKANDCEVTLVSSSKIVDQYTRSIREINNKYYNISNVSDEDACLEIRKMGLDVLVDLSGHTALGRPGVLARKPCVTQALWLGYFDSSGMKEVDYFLTSPFISQDTSIYDSFSEEPLLIDGPWFPYPVDGLPAVAELRRAYERPFTFGFQGNLSKVSEETLASWQRILRATPKANLLLRSPQLSSASVRSHYLKRLEGLGFNTKQIMLRGALPFKSYMEAYAEIDLILDPFPYSGGVGTIEALAMGTPVLTFRGDSFVSCMSSSFLECLGLTNLIAENRRDYELIASSFQHDNISSNLTRSEYRAILTESKVANAEIFAHNLIASLRRVA